MRKNQKLTDRTGHGGSALVKVAASAALQVLNPKMPMGKARRGEVWGRPWCNWMNRMLDMDNLHLLLFGLVSRYLGHGHENLLLLLLLRVIPF